MTSRGQAPRKHFRGKKAYFRRVHHDAAHFAIHPASDDWWDLWHYHADWRGWGNLRWRYRREHLRALVTVFQKIAAASEQFSTPFQTWIYLSGRDAGEDATYLHTPNRNGTAFPVELRNVTWGPSPLTPLFQEWLPGFSVRVGKSHVFDRYAVPPRPIRSFFIYCEGIGVPLE